MLNIMIADLASKPSKRGYNALCGTDGQHDEMVSPSGMMAALPIVVTAFLNV
jgi:hypothetical protein